jgi:hypothetical protein
LENFFQSLSCETLYKFEIRVYLVVGESTSRRLVRSSCGLVRPKFESGGWWVLGRLFDWRIYQPKTGMILMWPSAAEIRE